MVTINFNFIAYKKKNVKLQLLIVIQKYQKPELKYYTN